MSALKNKFDIDKRERNKSVVQRFITEKTPDSENNGGQPGEKRAFLPVMSAQAEPGESLKNDAGAISAQLEKLESRLEMFENKVGGLDGTAGLNQPKYMLFNAMEEAVREEVRATMNKANVCRCDKCYHDICALVLNNSPPQYVTTQEGVLIKKASALLSMDALTKLSAEIFNAINKVKDNPCH